LFVLNLDNVYAGSKSHCQNDVRMINTLPPSDAVQKKNIFEDFFSSILSQFQKYHPSENQKFNNLGIFQNLKWRTLVEKKSFQFLYN